MELARERTRRPRRSLLAKLALSLCVLAALALALEGAVRVRQWKRFGTIGRVHAFVTDPASGLLIPEPGRRTASIAIDSLGFRSPELERPKPSGRLRLAFLGGSTTFCAEASSNESTWPHQVWRRLSQDLPAGRLDYLNAAVGGYTLEQIDATLRQRVAPLEPDVIFLYEATNDLTRDSRELAQAQGVYRGHADEDSWISRRSLAWYLLEKNYLMRSRQAHALSGEGRLRFEPRELASGFRRRLEVLVREAQARARLVVLVTFSARVRREQTPEQRLEACQTSLFYMPYMTPDGLLAAFEEYNRAIREVAAATGALLIEAADAIPGDSFHFNDSVHLKDAGCRALAERVVEALQRAPAFRALVAQ